MAGCIFLSGLLSSTVPNRKEAVPVLRRTIYEGCDGYVLGVWPFVVEFNRFMVWARLGPLCLITGRENWREGETHKELLARSEAL
jgi:hypothetical protein